MSCEGDFVKAEHLLDCTVSEYYTRLKDRKQYIEWHNEQVKNMGKNNQ